MIRPTFVIHVGEDPPITLSCTLTHIPSKGDILLLPDITDDSLLVVEVSHAIRHQAGTHEIHIYTDRES